MSANATERVGVVVIHGVGETVEGWIDQHFVPQLEAWRAYASVDRLHLKTECPALRLTLEAGDGFIVTALGDDEDFQRFCKVIGLDHLAQDPGFRLQRDRVANRHELARQAGWPLSLQPRDHWLAELSKAGVPAAVAFDPESRVKRVRDPDSSEPAQTWLSYMRRLRIPGRDVLVTELFWADLSKVGTTTLSRTTAAIQLFLESPGVLGRAFLADSEAGVHRLVQRIVAFSNWLLRWPIAGLSVAVFTAAFLELLIGQLATAAWLPGRIGLILALTALLGYVLFREWVHRKIGLAELALSSAMSAVALLLLLGLAMLLVSPETLTRREIYLLMGVVLLLVSWMLWTLSTVLAVVILTGVAVKRLLGGRSPSSPPLARPAAAVALNLLLGMIWKLVLTLLGLLVVGALVETSLGSSSACPAGYTLVQLAADGADPACALELVRKLLVSVVVLNLGSILGVALAAAVVVGIRTAAVGLFRRRALEGRLMLPRLIASPLIVAALFAGAIVNAVVFYLLGIENEIADALRGWLPSGNMGSVGAALVGLMVFSFVLRRLLEASVSIIHIGRDLVDHQYDPAPRSMTMRLSEGFGRSAPEDAKRYRRRMRIQRRLEALIDEVIAAQRIDRLVLVAHSQGTVILHDYLTDHDRLTERTHAAGNALHDVERIDVLTVGSPLKHLYRYYFRDYDVARAPAESRRLIDRVASWTNLWRADDPIGQDVDVLAGIDNVGLGGGGHTDYWRENEVCARLWRLIDPARS